MKFQQTTGSHSYIAQCEALVNSCYFLVFCVSYYRIYIDLFQIQRKAHADQKEPEPNAVQIFKDCHTSKMKGMSTLVQAAIVSPYSSCLELIGTVMCSFSYLVCSQCQLLCSLLYKVVLTYHLTLHGLKEMKDILLVLICILVVMFTCAHNDKIACLFYICFPMIWMMSYYVHPTLNHVSLSLDVNECEEIDNTVGMLDGHMFRKWFFM